MTFVFPLLLGGTALVGVPVLIHLLMRQKPKTLPFPAFRFLVQRHRTNQRKLRLRHLLLLALRIGLILFICLALTRPKVFNEALKLGADRPVAAVLVFDTSPSMEYTVSSAKGKLTRLDDAKRRGRELLDQLPDGSRILILDTADPVLSGKGEWLTSRHQAGKRIDSLRLRHGGGPVTARIEDAYRLFNDLANTRSDDATRHLARLLVVFSDRTPASWDTGRTRQLEEARDQVPPPFERLPQLRDRVPGLVELLGELRTRLSPPAGQDFPEKSLSDLLEQAREQAAGLSEEEYPDAGLSKLVTAARGRTRELLRALDRLGKDVPEAAKDYHAKLRDVLLGFLHDLRGVHEVYIDVGVDDPADGALLDFELPRSPRQNAPRQVFAADEKVIVRAALQATGKDVDNMLRWTVDGKRQLDQAVKVKAGEKQTFAFEIDCKKLAPGEHQLQADLVNPDLLPANNTRYLTFALRQPRHILVVSDDPAKAQRWQDALEALRGLSDFRVKRMTPADCLQAELKGLNGYQAVYLFDVAEPKPELWTLLKRYVAGGGGLGVVPGGEEVKADAYNSAEAKALLPGQLQGVQKANGPAGRWDFNRIPYQHPMMARYREWKAENADLVRNPRTASRYWQVKVDPKDKNVTVLAKYASNEDPALLERLVGGAGGRPGRVLLFTTTFDRRTPPWNDYLDTLNSFYLALAYQATSHLAGDTEPVQLNFVSGQTVPVVTLPLAQRLEPTPYKLARAGGEGVEVTVEAGQNVLRLPQAIQPGNYVIEGEGQHVAAFSVNLPQEETDLRRLPVAEVESLFGKGAVAPVDVRADLRAALIGLWSDPEELLPWLLVALLIALGVEIVLANKFYRREPEAQA
jgi:hypothetical protein